MAENVNSSLEKFLTSQLLALEKSGSVHHVIPVRKDISIIQSEPVLVVHHKRFFV